MKPVHASSLVLATVLLATSLRAADLTPWDSMPPGPVAGSVTVQMKSGKKIHADAASFSASSVSLFDGPVISRDEVGKVTVRKGRTDGWCWRLWLAACDIGPSFNLIKDDWIGGSIAFIFVVAATAVTLPPALAIEGVRDAIPAKKLYVVRP
jgi:hypothetical protein